MRRRLQDNFARALNSHAQPSILLVKCRHHSHLRIEGFFALLGPVLYKFRTGNSRQAVNDLRSP
jgi:hypothetical protein